MSGHEAVVESERRAAVRRTVECAMANRGLAAAGWTWEWHEDSAEAPFIVTAVVSFEKKIVVSPGYADDPDVSLAFIEENIIEACNHAEDREGRADPSVDDMDIRVWGEDKAFAESFNQDALQ